MSLLELGEKYWEVYWVRKYRSAMHGYTHVISQSILHRKRPCHACYVIMFYPHNFLPIEHEYITMHGLLVTLKNLFVRTEHDYITCMTW